MAIVRPSPIIGAISGNLGGTNFAQTRAGLVARKRSQVIHRTSSILLASQNNFLRVQNLWITTTEERRQAWRAAASLISFPNRLGINHNLSGYQLFMKQMLGVGFFGSPALDPPTSITRLPSIPALVLTPFGPASLIATWAEITAAQATRFIWQATRTFSSNPRTTFHRWRFILLDKPGFGIEEQQMAPEFNAVWGEPFSGELIAVRGRLNTGAAFDSPWVIASAFA
jgi:hypothetical protein